MLTTGSHSLSGFLFCDEGVYLMYTTEKQDEKRPRYANEGQHKQVRSIFRKFKNNEISN